MSAQPAPKLAMTLATATTFAMTSRTSPTIRQSAVFAGALVFFALAYPRVARADLVVLQESNGFPGADDSANAKQKVLIGDDRLKVLDDAHGWALFVRLDKSVVDEAWASEKGYVEKPLSDYAKIRDDREKTRADKVAEYKAQVAKATTDSDRANLKRALEAMGLREDGKTFARLETFPDDKKKVQLVVNNEKKEVELVRHQIRENEGKDPIFEIWAAPSIARPSNVFRFYKEIGTFSDAVVAELMKLPDFPVEIKATLDNGNNSKTLHSRVYEIRDEKIDAVEYDLPASFKKVEGKPQEKGQLFKCAICGKECVPESGSGATFFKSPWTGERFPVCCEEHRNQLIKRLAEEARKNPNPGPPK